MSYNPKVSMLLVCYNSEKYVEESLGAYLAQDIGLNNIEIIVVDGGSSDNTILKCKQILEVSDVEFKIIHNSKKTLAAGWNLALREARGEFVCRIDAHSSIPSNYLRVALERYSELPKEAAAIGGVLINVSDSLFGSFATDFYSSKLGVGNSPFRIMSDGVIESDTSVFGVYRRSLFNKVGFFNEKLSRNQDIEFHKRVIAAGYKMYTDYSLVIEYYVRSDFISFLKKAYNDGFWVIKSDSYYLRHLVPLFFFLYLILAVISGGGGIHNITPYLGAGLYFILVLIFSIKDGSTIMSKVILPILYSTYHISYGYGSFRALISKLFKQY